jgi:hypothetical protein
LIHFSSQPLIQFSLDPEESADGFLDFSNLYLGDLGGAGRAPALGYWVAFIHFQIMAFEELAIT